MRSPDRASLDDPQPTYFLGLIFRRPSFTEKDVSELSQQAATLNRIPNTSTSIMTSSLRAKASRIRKNNIPQIFPESGRIDNLSSLLSSRIARVYREDDQFLLGIDNKFSQSLDDAGQHKRLHAGPRDIHIAMGRINLYSRPKKEKYLSSVNGAFDIFWMRMAVENPEHWTAEQPWRDLQWITSKLLEAEINRARIEDRPDCFAILFCEYFVLNPLSSGLISIVWRSREKRITHYQAMTRPYPKESER